MLGINQTLFHSDLKQSCWLSQMSPNPLESPGWISLEINVTFPNCGIKCFTNVESAGFDILKNEKNHRMSWV